MNYNKSMSNFQTKEEYFEIVFNVLESFHYPELILEFDTRAVAQSLGGCMVTQYILGTSPMMCAILIFSMTMNYQVIPAAKRSIQH